MQNPVFPSVSQIPLLYHYYLLRDESRTMGFKKVIQDVVRLNDKVLEIGSGTGILSFFAASLGAYVTALEIDSDNIQASELFLSQNGVASRVHVLNLDAVKTLPDGDFDIVICEMMFPGLLEEKQIPVMRTLERMGKQYRRIIPMGAELALDAGYSNYDFFGFYAPFIHFYDPNDYFPLTTCRKYMSVDFSKLPKTDFINKSVKLKSNKSGLVNSVAIHTTTKMTEDKILKASPEYCWPLIYPLHETIEIVKGASLQVDIEYVLGDSYKNVNIQVHVI